MEESKEDKTYDIAISYLEVCTKCTGRCRQAGRSRPALHLICWPIAVSSPRPVSHTYTYSFHREIERTRRSLVHAGPE
jgi:hypothetical protein